MLYKQISGVAMGKHIHPPIIAYHFFSGMGRGTVLTLHGALGCPDTFLPNTVPTRFNGKITNVTMHTRATLKYQNDVRWSDDNNHHYYHHHHLSSSLFYHHHHLSSQSFIINIICHHHHFISIIYMYHHHHHNH